MTTDGNGQGGHGAWRARLPRMVGQGRRASVAALVERVVAQLIEETGGDVAHLPNISTETKRLQLLLPVVDYVLAVESIRLTTEEKADVVEAVYSAVFGYGGLDAHVVDDALTTVLLDGPAHAAVRPGHGMLQEVTPLFDDRAGLTQVVGRMMADARLADDGLDGLLMAEFGLTLGARRAGVTVTAQADGALRVDMRLHPATPVTLETWGGGVLVGAPAELLRALAASGRGVLLAGAAESGKTTLLGALAAASSGPRRTVSVERANELALPPDVPRYGAPMRWDVDQPNAPDTFADGVTRALADVPDVLLLDEMRDDPAVIGALLQSAEPGPQLMVAMRATTDPARITAALSLLARRSVPGAPDHVVARWFARVPYAVVLRRTQDAVRLQRVIGWAWHSDHARPVVLLDTDNDRLAFTGNTPPVLVPGLPADFWRARRA